MSLEKTAQDIAVLMHRVTTLEVMPPRVHHLESDMAGVKREIHLAREEIGQVKIEVHLTGQLARQIDIKMSKLFWTGAGIALTITVVIAATKILIEIIDSGLVR